jgi:hypothetical protein
MTGLPSEIYRRCRSVFLKCSEFNNDTALLAVFVTDELRPFQHGLPEATNKKDRVGQCLDFLLHKRLSDGRPVLPLFLTTLRNKYEPGDALRDDLDALAEDTQVALSAAQQPDKARLFICYKRHADPDEGLAVYLHDALTAQGHEVFIDQSMRSGDEWMERIDQEIKASDILVVLLSEASVDSEMVRAEVFRAYEYRKEQGRPFTLPVRVAFAGMLPYPIQAFLGPLQYVTWRSGADNERIAQEILAAIAGRLPEGAPVRVSAVDRRDDEPSRPPSPECDPRILKELAVPGGVVRMRDKLYIEREADTKLKEQIVKRGTTTTIRAPRQTGKTSLLVRGAHFAREQGANVAFLDFQSFSSEQRASLDVFLREVAESICDELDLDECAVDEAWDGRRSASKKLIRYMEKRVLPAFDGPVVLAMDEADSLLQTDFYRDFFGLLRSWHNRRAYREAWKKLNIVLVISTEPYLLIDDIHQSPFSVGLDLGLADFSENQVRDLNRRHGSPVAEADLLSLTRLLHGHPFLTRRALYAMVAEGTSWAELVRDAPTDRGPFSDHLRRQYWGVRDKSGLKKALKEILKTGRCSDEMALFRLLRAGLVKGSGDAYECRCDLYRLYFEQKLLGE